MTDEQIQNVVFLKPAVARDTRPFLVRLLASLRVSIKPKLSGGRIVPEISVKGGTDF